MDYFVTGATGFIGRHLVERLLEREGNIHVLVRDGSEARLEALRRGWGPTGARVIPVTGDLLLPRLGVGEASLDELRGCAFFHVAALYDMAAEEEAPRTSFPSTSSRVPSTTSLTGVGSTAARSIS